MRVSLKVRAVILAVVFSLGLLVTATAPVYAATLKYNLTDVLTSATSVTVRDITVDSSGNMYVVGWFNGTTDFDPSAGVHNITPSGGAGAYLAKYSSAGALIWVRTLSGSASVTFNSVSLDASGNPYVVGNFLGTINFDGTGGTTDNKTASAGGGNGFVSRYNSDGSYGWTRAFLDAVADSTSTVIVDTTNNYVYVAGEYASSMNFDGTGGTDNHTAVGSTDFFITKYSTAGAYVSTLTTGSANSEHVSNHALALDSSNNIYLVGTFAGNMDFDATAGTDSKILVGSTDSYLTSYTSGGAYRWTRTFGGTSASTNVNNLAISGTTIALVGLFNGNVNFNGAGGTDNHAAVGSNDAFLSSYTTVGAYNYAKTWDTPSTTISADVVGFAADGMIHVGGTFFGTTDFDPSAGVASITPNGGANSYALYVSSFNPDGSYVNTYTSQAITTGQLGFNVLTTDAAGNLYYGGYFLGTNFDFDPTVTNDFQSSQGTDYNGFFSKWSVLAATTTGAPNTGYAKPAQTPWVTYASITSALLLAGAFLLRKHKTHF